MLLVQAIACDGHAAGGVQLQLLPSRAMWMIMYFHAVLGDGRGCMSLVSLRKSNYIFDMHTHQIPPGCGLLGRTGPRRRPSGGFRPHAREHTHAHTTPAIRAPTTRANTRAHERAAPARPPHMRWPPLQPAQPPLAHLQPARLPRRAASRRRSPSPPAPLSPPREAARLPPLPPLPPSCSALRLRWPLPPTRNL